MEAELASEWFQPADRLAKRLARPAVDHQHIAPFAGAEVGQLDPRLHQPGFGPGGLGRWRQRRAQVLPARHHPRAVQRPRGHIPETSRQYGDNEQE
jgi:hypothetical protein